MSFRAARDAAAAQAKEAQQKKQQKKGAAAARAGNAANHAVMDAPAAPTPALAAAAAPSAPAGAIPASSRLCVKGVPEHVSEERLRSLFSAQAEHASDAVTDVKLLRTHDGRSRKMAFIGYRTAAAAAKARKHFNKSYIDTSRIEVEFAVNPREAREALRPWSKYSEGSSRHEEREARHHPQAAAAKSAGSATAAPADAASLSRSAAKSSPLFSKSALFGLASDTQLSSLLNDPKFQEYLHVMGSRSKNKFWSDNMADVSAAAKAKPQQSTADELEAVRTEQGFQTYEQYLAEQRGDKKAGAGADSDDDDDAFNQPMLERDVDEDAAAASASKSPKVTPAAAPSAAHNAALSDADYFRSKQSNDSDFDDDSDMEDTPAAAAAAADGAAPAKGTKRKHAEVTTAGDAAASAVPGMHPSRAARQEGDAEEDEGDAQLRAEYERDEAAAGVAAAEQKDAQELLDSGRLFLRNLSYTVTEEDLRGLLSPFGQLSEVHVPLDSTPARQPKGFAYASFLFPADALSAQRSLDGSFFLGRLLHILNARPKPVVKSAWDRLQEAGDAAKDATTYKKKKELQMQAHAASAKDQASWNTLFVRSDTVTESIAAKYGLQKSDILDTSAASRNEDGTDGSTAMAVRLALAETQLISETKKFLAEHGVSLSAFDGPRVGAARSDSAILVKNLPFNTELDEVRRLFAKFGQLAHVVMPPSRAVVLLEFTDPRDAKAAFKGLAYKKFKYQPLYLEWAPKGAFSATPATAAGAAAPAAGVVEGKKKAAEELLQTSGSAGADEAGPAASTSASVSTLETQSSTLYVKNLSFSTTEAALLSLFSGVAPVRSVSISRKKNTKARPGTNDPAFLSMGFGFVELRSPADAAKAMQQLQGTQLDNHALDIKLSSRGAAAGQTATAAAGKPAAAAAAPANPSGSAIPSSKLLVKNVPFETTARELRDLFSAFGTIQRIRLPKKFGQLGHRGFAFVDFVTKSEAAHALEQVKHSHLYGRHLVIEYAAPTAGDGSEQEVEQLRAKTAAKFAAAQQGAPPNKKRKTAQDQDADDIDAAFSSKFT